MSSQTWYESAYGYPPVVARHFRTARPDGRPQCGPHQHVVCTDEGCEEPHWDSANPDCPQEAARHMTNDFWPTLHPVTKAVVVGGLVVGGALLLGKLFR